MAIVLQSKSVNITQNTPRIVPRSEISIPPEKLKLLERRPSKVGTIFEVEALWFSLRRSKHVLGKKTKSCSVTFKENELIFIGAKESKKQMYTSDLRTTLVSAKPDPWWRSPTPWQPVTGEKQNTHAEMATERFFYLNLEK